MAEDWPCGEHCVTKFRDGNRGSGTVHVLYCTVLDMRHVKLDMLMSFGSVP